MTAVASVPRLSSAPAQPLAVCPGIAVVIPCRDEEASIVQVVRGFCAALPGVAVHVGDNGSKDRTAAAARAAGARVWTERRAGKGFMVRMLFAAVDADVYVLADGDGELTPRDASALLAPVLAGDADMVVGSRFLIGRHARVANDLANRLLTGLVNISFGLQLTDVLCGYRVMSRRVVKHLPLLAGGFELEVEQTIKAAQRGYRIVEVPIASGKRAAGSSSKVRPLLDGFTILRTILSLVRDYRPLRFYGSSGLLGLVLAALLLGWGRTAPPGSAEALLATTMSDFLFGVSLLFGGVGLVLHSITRRSVELEHQVATLFEEIAGERSHRTSARAARGVD